MSHGKTNKFHQIIFHKKIFWLYKMKKFIKLSFQYFYFRKVLKFLIGLREKLAYELSSWNNLN